MFADQTEGELSSFIPFPCVSSVHAHIPVLLHDSFLLPRSVSLFCLYFLQQNTVQATRWVMQGGLKMGGRKGAEKRQRQSSVFFFFFHGTCLERTFHPYFRGLLCIYFMSRFSPFFSSELVRSLFPVKRINHCFFSVSFTIIIIRYKGIVADFFSLLFISVHSRSKNKTLV